MIIATILLAPKVDFIIIDTYSTVSFWYTFFCSQVARIFKTKYIPILHGGNLPVRLKKNPKLCEMIFSHSFANVAPSHYLKNAFANSGFHKTIFIPNVLEISEYAFFDRKNLNPKLLWVRAFDKIYNPIMAIYVVIELKKKYSNVALCMVGPDKDGSQIETKEFALKNDVNVTFPGKLTKKEWTKLALDYDIFINTTHIDNTPVSVMEALALGLPVVSTNVGGLPFLIQDQKDGLLVDDNDAQSMAKKIDLLIENPEFANQIITSGRQKVAGFDWKQVKILWNNLLNN
jgi:L-malate glycosyltransferase